MEPRLTSFYHAHGGVLYSDTNYNGEVPILTTLFDLRQRTHTTLTQFTREAHMVNATCVTLGDLGDDSQVVVIGKEGSIVVFLDTHVRIPLFSLFYKVAWSWNGATSQALMPR
jgi:hypothetical protein